MATGEVHFWSRSRGEIWRKGETSGNVLRLVALFADCDGDTVLALVHPSGPACHTGEVSCFGDGATPTAAGPLDALWSVIEDRASALPEGSYTTRLLGDENLRLKKLGEETAELVVALAQGDRERIPEEAADLFYHLLAALKGAGVELRAVPLCLRGATPLESHGVHDLAQIRPRPPFFTDLRPTGGLRPPLFLAGFPRKPLRERWA